MYICHEHEWRTTAKKEIIEWIIAFILLSRSMSLRFEWKQPRKLANNKTREWATTAVIEGSNNKLDREN